MKTLERKLYVCKLSFMVMRDPVVASDGFTYERDYIEKHLEKNNTSPVTNKSLRNKKLTSNRDLKSAIEKYLTKHPEIFSDDSEDVVYLPNKYWNRLSKAKKSQDEKACHELYKLDPRLKKYTRLEAQKRNITLKREHKYPVEIELLEGKNLTLFVHSNTQIRDLKKEFCKRNGLTDTRFIFAGRQLEDDRTVADSNIKKDDNIFAVQRLKGD